MINAAARLSCLIRQHINFVSPRPAVQIVALDRRRADAGAGLGPVVFKLVGVVAHGTVPAITDHFGHAAFPAAAHVVSDRVAGGAIDQQAVPPGLQGLELRLITRDIMLRYQAFCDISFMATSPGSQRDVAAAIVRERRVIDH